MKKLFLCLGFMGVLAAGGYAAGQAGATGQTEDAYAPGVKIPEERLINKADLVAANPYEGVYSRRIYTDTVWITIVRIEEGAVTGFHNHPDEQTMMIETGRVRAYVRDKQYDLGPDDVLIIPSYVPHSVEALTEATWTEVHGPGFDNTAKWAQED